MTKQMMLTTVLAVSAMMAVGAQAETYKVDTAASQITWKGTKKVTGSGHNGTVGVKEGTVEINKGEVTAANIVADMKTIKDLDMASSPEDAKKLEGHLSSPDFFDVNKPGHETATFKLTKIEKKGAGHVAKGDLTFVGKTNPVEFPVTFTVDKGVATGEGKFEVDRTQYGLVYGSEGLLGKIKELTADKVINSKFELGFKVVAKADAAPAKPAAKKKK